MFKKNQDNKVIKTSGKRWIALDFFRGLTIALMIIANNPGDWKEEYYQLQHAEWFGITFADFIAPIFIFIMGVSIALAFSKQLEKGVNTKIFYKKIAKRAVILFLLGLSINLLLMSAWGGFRIVGVLQRIAIVYVVCSILFLKTKWKTQLMIGLGVLIAYCLLFLVVPVPGLGKVSLSVQNNWLSWVDTHFLPGLLYARNHDPEGILGTFPAIVTGISGMLVGTLLKRSLDKKDFVKKVLPYGIITLAAGLLWSLIFPLSKHIWSSSYVLVTSGTGILFLSLCTWLMDIKSWKKGAFPFIVFGSNAITAYMLSFILWVIVWPPFFGGANLMEICTNIFVNIGFSAKFSSLIWAVLYTAVIYVPIYFLYKKKKFIKV